MKLNERLRELRKERNLTLKEVCSSADISIPFLSDIERGRTTPSVKTLKTMADYYGITVQELLAPVRF